MKRLFTIITISVLLLFPQFTSASDLDDLKAAYEKYRQAQNSLDAEAMSSLYYPGMAGYREDSAFPVTAPKENTQTIVANLFKIVFGNIESLNITPYNMQFRVIGDMGLVWGHETENRKEKGLPSTTKFFRHTTTWIKSDGKWFIIMGHLSKIPSGD